MYCNHSGKRWFKNGTEEEYQKNMGAPVNCIFDCGGKIDKNIQRVIVSTDSEEIREIAKRYGAEVPFLRPAEYAQDTSADIDFMKHAIQWLYENEGKVPEYLVHMRPTTPIRSPKIIEDAIMRIQRIKKQPLFDLDTCAIIRPINGLRRMGNTGSP